MKQTHSRGHKIIHPWILVQHCLLASSLFPFSFGFPSASNALTASDLEVTRVTPFALIDKNTPCASGPTAMHIEVEVRNTSGSTLNNLTANIHSFTNSDFRLNTGESANRYVGTLAPDEIRTLYWFVSYCHNSNSDGQTTDYSVTLSDGGMTSPFTQAGLDLTTRNSQKAAAGGDVFKVTVGDGVVAGQLLPVTVEYDFGNPSNNNADATFQPVGNSDFSSSCYQLQEAVITSSTYAAGPVVNSNSLYFPNATSGNSQNFVTVEYIFLALCTNQATVANPFAEQKSGGALKYTSNFGAQFASLPQPSNAFTITKSVSATNPDPLPTAGGTATYTVTITNTSSFETRIERIIDVLPAGLSFASTDSGTSPVIVNYSSSQPSAGDTGTLNWIAQPSNIAANNFYVIPANGSINLVYTVNVPAGENSYLNSATAQLGSASVGPATATVSVGTALQPPTVDLDASDSSSNDFSTTFSVGSGAVNVTDTDVEITDSDGNFIDAATIVLTNRPDGSAESLTIDPTAGGTVSGVSLNAYNSATGELTLSSDTTGTITRSQYEAIVATLRYDNSNPSPNTSDRTITVTVTDSDALDSAAATSTIRIFTPSISGDVCYLVADNDGVSGSPDLLTQVDRLSGVEVAIGGTGTSGIEAIAFDPISGTLYAVNAGQFGSLSLTTGTFSPIGSGIGFSDVDGLTVDPYTQEIFGAVRLESAPDRLIKINPTTGAVDPNGFGPGVSSVEIPLVNSSLDDVDDLTVDPSTGQLFGIANNGGSGDRYIWINRETGAIEDEGPLNINDMEGLSSFNQGQIYGTTGNTESMTGDSFYIVDSSNGSASLQFPLSLGQDYEAVDCLTGTPNTLSGTIFLDQDLSGDLNAADTGSSGAVVELYRDDGMGNIVDINRDSVIDSGDALAVQTTTNGAYSFTLAGSGPYILKVDPSSIPTGATFTTSGGQNLATADFGNALGLSITDRNIGHIGPFTIGDRVWYDLDQEQDQDANEVGLIGVNVNLRSGTCASSGSIIDTATTGSNGSYTFDLVSPGDYCVDVDELTLPASGFNNTTSNDPLDITVTTSNITTADFGYIATSCLPRIDFETDAAGNPLSAGTQINNQWAGWGIQISSDDQTNTPANLFDSANPTGGDTDLGAPNADFSGPGVGDGGGSGTPGANALAQGLMLIINETSDTSIPDDDATGGTITFTFDTPLRVDEVSILDTDSDRFNGTIVAYDAKTGGNVLASSPIYAYGDNSFQVVSVGATNVQRLEVNFETSGSIPVLDFCADTPASFGNLGDRIWRDLNQDGLQNSGEPGIASVDLELLIPGLSGIVFTAQTDANGLYQFSNLAPGTYDIKIANSNTSGALSGLNYSPRNVGSNDAIDSDFESTTQLAPAVVTSGNSNTSVDGGFFNPAVSNQSLLLVKRVTAINTTAITALIDGTGSEDNDPQWPGNYLQGSIDSSIAQPGDEIEYTIYFLSNGYADLTDVNICDLIPADTTYVPGSGKIAFDTTETAWSDSRDADQGDYIEPNTTVTEAAVPGIGLCRESDHTPGQDFISTENPNGAVWVEIDKLNSPISPGDRGYIRFRVQVNQTPDTLPPVSPTLSN